MRKLSNTDWPMKDSYKQYIHGDKAILPYGIQEIEENAFSECSSLIGIEIPNTVTRIGKNAFHGCLGLASIEIPDSVTEIGERAFSGCTSLTSIEIPDSVITIGSKFVVGCSNLSSIIVSPNNQSFKEESGCLLDISGETLLAGTKKSIIPRSVTRINSCAFCGCCGLTDIEIPDSVKEIGKGVFARCPNMNNIKVSSNNQSFKEESGCLLDISGSILFAGTAKSNIPRSVTRITMIIAASARVTIFTQVREFCIALREPK